MNLYGQVLCSVQKTLLPHNYPVPLDNLTNFLEVTEVVIITSYTRLAHSQVRHNPSMQVEGRNQIPAYLSSYWQLLATGRGRLSLRCGPWQVVHALLDGHTPNSIQSAQTRLNGFKKIRTLDWVGTEGEWIREDMGKEEI